MKERDKFYFKLSLPALIITFLIFLLPLFSVLGRAFINGPEAVINTFRDAYTWRLLAFTVWESFLSAIISAGEFKPSLHTAPSVRQQGFGGFYSTDLDNFYGIYANPAILGLHAKHSLFPSIDVRAAGLLKDSVNIINAVSNKDMEKLGKIINDNNGIQLGMDIAPLLSFGHISNWGF